jgi:hypothetical protein
MEFNNKREQDVKTKDAMLNIDGNGGLFSMFKISHKYIHLFDLVKYEILLPCRSDFIYLLNSIYHINTFCPFSN